MSSILDALKKSDQERLRQAPLPGISRYEEQRRNRSRGGQIILLVAALLLIASGTWYWHTASVEQTGTVMTENPALQSTAELTSVPQSSAVIATEPDLPANETPQTIAEEVVDVELTDNDLDLSEPVVNEITSPEPVVSAEPSSELGRAAPQTQPAEPLDQPDQALMPSQTATIETDPEETFLLLSDIDSATREQIQSFRISIVVYDPEPGRRFALINSRRMTEGQSINDQIRLEKIRRDGLVMTTGSGRVLVPSR